MHHIMNTADADQASTPTRAKIAMSALAIVVLGLVAAMAWAAWLGMASVREVTQVLTQFMTGPA